jgi:hypothetical protein
METKKNLFLFSGFTLNKQKMPLFLLNKGIFSLDKMKNGKYYLKQ